MRVVQRASKGLDSVYNVIVSMVERQCTHVHMAFHILSSVRCSIIKKQVDTSSHTFGKKKQKFPVCHIWVEDRTEFQHAVGPILYLKREGGVSLKPDWILHWNVGLERGTALSNWNVGLEYGTGIVHWLLNQC